MAMDKQRMQLVEWHYQKAADLALEQVEIEAKKILKRHPHLGEYIMAMGSWFFTDKAGEIAIDNSSDFKYLEPLQQLMADWDRTFGLTGSPMRFTATGEKVTDW